jgi:hypothetical protein
LFRSFGVDYRSTSFAPILGPFHLEFAVTARFDRRGVDKHAAGRAISTQIEIDTVVRTRWRESCLLSGRFTLCTQIMSSAIFIVAIT